MTPDEYDKISEIIKKSVKDAVHETAPETRQLINILIKQNENMDAFQHRVRAHMERVEPVIKAYEDSQVMKIQTTAYGERAIFWSKVIGALGILYIAARMGLINVINWRP